MIVSEVLSRIKKGVIVACFKLLHQCSAEGSEKFRTAVNRFCVLQ
jgi:hypothetical protein